MKSLQKLFNWFWCVWRSTGAKFQNGLQDVDVIEFNSEIFLATYKRELQRKV